MGYRRLLLTRWSRRDWLAVGLVALTAVFLVGASLTLVTAGETIQQRTTSFGTSATATYHDGAVDPSGTGDPDPVVLPIAAVTLEGEEVMLVGIPADAPRTLASGSRPWTRVRLSDPPPAGTIVGPDTTTSEVVLTGTEGTITVTVEPTREGRLFPPDWYVATATAVDRVGQTATLVIRPERGAGGSAPDTPGVTLLSMAAYLLAGARELVGTLALVTVGSGLLVAVALYSVTRMTVRDRLQTVAVARTTGSSRWQLLGLFALRAASIAAAGVAVGAAVGIIIVNVVVNAAVSLGIVTTLTPRVTPAVLRVLGPALLGLITLGTAAGVAATWRTVRVPPAALGTDTGGRRRLGSPGSTLGRATELEVLRWRALAPTAVALTVFATVLLLTVSVTGALAPLGAPSSGVIADPGAPNLLASNIERDTADALRAQNVPASPEIVVPQVTDGQPYLVRGANYTSFETLTDATIVASVKLSS